MRCRRLLLLAIVLGLVPACRSAKIKNPDPIQAAQTPAKTRDAILEGINVSSWAAYKELPDTIRAKLVVSGKHELQVAIYYDAQQVRMQYEGSRNLDYVKRSKNEYIHSNAVVWMQSLWSQIQQSVADARSES